MQSNKKLSQHYYFARENELIPSISKKTLSTTDLIENHSNNTPRGMILFVPNKWANSRFIALFDKTEGDIVCPHFWEFKPFIGCPFKCHYCYLQGTFWGNKSPRLKDDFKKIAHELDRFLSWADTQNLKLLLNSGELADSLAVKSWTREMIKYILPVLEEHRNHKILLLTKAGAEHVKILLENNHTRKFFIISVSINTPRIAKIYEEGAAPVESRLEAVKILQKNKFIVRIRIDPMIPAPGWIADYNLLIHMIFHDYNLKPERITLGSLRGLGKTIKYASDVEWTRYFDYSEYTEWGYKLNKDLRLEMYKTAILKTRKSGYSGPIALCKETLDIWNALHQEGLINSPGTKQIWENVTCNCKL